MSPPLRPFLVPTSALVMLSPTGRYSGSSLRLFSLVVLVTDLVAICASQPVVPTRSENSNVCLVPKNSPFDAFHPVPDPVCLPADAPPPPPSDEFLSFEDWKSLKLEETSIPTPERGTNPNPSDPSLHTAEPVAHITSTLDGAVPVPSPRVPLTDRFNYASSECSARIQGVSKSIKSPWAILNSKRDKYMLSPCSPKEKFVILELCDDIQIGAIVLTYYLRRIFTENCPKTRSNWRTLSSFLVCSRILVSVRPKPTRRTDGTFLEHSGRRIFGPFR